MQTRVLLADDHAVVRAGIKNAIEELNQLQVVGEAADGPSLHHALNLHKPDLLLIDITMPGFDPIPAIQRFRKTYPEMKILVVSAYDDDVYVQGLLKAGVNGYHLKDQSLKDLRLAVQRVLDGERWISSPLVDKLISFQEPGTIKSPLSSRQRDILHMLQKGKSNQEIALELNLSVKTIENHLTRIYRTIDVKSRVEAVAFLTNNPHLLGPTLAVPELSSWSDPNLTKDLSLLLVDDNPQFRQQLNRMIGNLVQKAKIYEAESIQGALKIAAATSLQLIMVDVLLGDEDGIMCAKELKKISPQSRIILISAYPDEEFRREGVHAGAAAFIDKKLLDLATLNQIINDIISGSDD